MGFVLSDLSDLLTSGGITTTIYQGFMPPTPVEAIQLVVSGGFEPVRAFASTAGEGIVVERPTVQIVRRSATLLAAMVEMQTIFRMLDGEGDRAINGTRYQWIGALQQPFDLGRDANEHPLWAMNIIVAKAPTTSTST